MTDLSDGSHFWWMKVMQACDMWYKDSAKLRPLQKATFSIQPSGELRKLKWTNPQWCQRGVNQHEEDCLQADDALPTWLHSGEDGDS